MSVIGEAPKIGLSEAALVESMAQITLPGTQIQMSRLGFGCSGLMARLSRAESLRLLNVAFDSGITHFDTARLYGYGEAEGVLGQFLKGKRNRVTVTTKLGILPPRRSNFLSMARGLARRLVTLHPSLRRAARRRAESMVRQGAFDIPTATASLETSLRELGTDNIDLLLLHECGVEDLERSELLEFLERCRRHGKIKTFGLATDIATTMVALERFRAYACVAQFPDSAWEPNLQRLAPLRPIATLTHSVLGIRFIELCKCLEADPIRARLWKATLGFPPEDRTALAELFLARALVAAPTNVVLTSSQSEHHIRANARAATVAGSRTAQITALDRLLAGENSEQAAEFGGSAGARV